MEIWLRKRSAIDSSITMVYRITVLDNISFNFNSPISPSPLPEEGGDKNILIKITGNTNTLSLSWILKEETVNIGVAKTGTSGKGGNVKTIFEQVKWLTEGSDSFVGTGIDDSFEILVLENDTHWNTSDPHGDAFIDNLILTGNESVKKGYFRSFGFSTTGGEPVTLRARLDFIEGDVITGYNGNTPTAVRNFTIDQGDENGASTDTKLYITWDHPLQDGGSTILVYEIFYRPSGNYNWLIDTISAVNNAKVLTPLSVNTSYDIKVVPRNANGFGEMTHISTLSTST